VLQILIPHPRLTGQHGIVRRICLQYERADAIFIFKSDPDFEIAIAITIPIEKPIRINRDPIFTVQSRSLS